MQPDLENLGLQDLSDMLINKTKEFMQLVEMKNYDAHAMRQRLTEMGELQEVINAYWKKKKVLQC